MQEKHEAEQDLMRRVTEAKISRIEEEKKITLECLREEQKFKRQLFELQKMLLLKK